METGAPNLNFLRLFIHALGTGTTETDDGIIGPTLNPSFMWRGKSEIEK